MDHKTLNDYLGDASLAPWVLVPEEVVCEGLGVKPSGLYQWRAKKNFPHPLRLPGHRRKLVYHLGSLRDFIDECVKETNAYAYTKHKLSGV